MKIKFNEIYNSGNETKYIEDCINRQHTCGDGYYSKKASKFIETTFSTQKAFLTTSCTSALEMAMILLDVKQGDEVILPSFTFVSCANSVILRGAKCVFAEVDETLNIDLDDVKRKITKKTKAVMPVHYASTSCDMDKLMEMSKTYGFFVIEDAAQAFNAKYKDKYLGTIGHLGCYSFHQTKNYSCGEGGALLINTPNENWVEKAEIIREKGTNRRKFLNGEIDKYTWINKGSSFLLSDILSAYLCAQFEKLEEINNLRKKIYEKYQEAFKPLEEKRLIKINQIPSYSKINYHMFYLLFDENEKRNKIMNHLKTNGVQAVFHYIPLHSSPMGTSTGYKKSDLPYTQKASECILRLPLYAGMENEKINYVIEKILDYYKHK